MPKSAPAVSDSGHRPCRACGGRARPSSAQDPDPALLASGGTGGTLGRAPGCTPGMEACPRPPAPHRGCARVPTPASRDACPGEGPVPEGTARSTPAQDGRGGRARCPGAGRVGTVDEEVPPT